MSDKIQEIVREMAGLTILSGKLNPIQEKNLKMYPFVVFDGVKSVSIDYDLSRPEGSGENVNHCSRVMYDIKIEQEPTDLEKRLKFLEAAVRNLFWNEVPVLVQLNGKLVFESRK